MSWNVCVQIDRRKGFSSWNKDKRRYPIQKNREKAFYATFSFISYHHFRNTLLLYGDDSVQYTYTVQSIYIYNGLWYGIYMYSQNCNACKNILLLLYRTCMLKYIFIIKRRKPIVLSRYIHIYYYYKKWHQRVLFVVIRVALICVGEFCFGNFNDAFYLKTIDYGCKYKFKFKQFIDLM